MYKNDLKHIPGNLYRELKEYIKNIEGGFNVEAIHQFRVSYKKLRVFLHMMSGDNKKKIKISKQLKKVYKKLGRIRDIQLQQDRISEASKGELYTPKVYMKLLDKTIKELKEVQIEISKKHLINHSQKKTGDALSGKFRLTGLSNFVQKKWKNIEVIILTRRFNDENIHTIRKCLKELVYYFRLIERMEQGKLSLSVLKGKTWEYFDKLQQELGDYQDKCNSIILLESYWPQNADTRECQLLEGIKKRWMKEKLKAGRLLITKLMSIDFNKKQNK